MVARLLLFIPHGGQIIVIHSPWWPDYCYSFPMVARLLLFIPHGGQIIVIHSPWWPDYCYSEAISTTFIMVMCEVESSPQMKCT
jgi:hypothetical protein